MTHSIDAPFPPPPAPAGTRSGESTGSTTDIARTEAANLRQNATEAGGQVASTATDQAREVVHETQQQAMNLLDQGRSQVREQARTQQHRAAQGLGSLAQELRGIVDGSGTSSSGPAHDLLQQATGKLEDLAGRLQDREPGQLLDEVRSFARRKPGTFLLGAALAGVVAGRLTRGVQASHSGNDSGGQHREPHPQTRYAENYVEPGATYPTAPTAPSLETTGTAPTGVGRAAPPPPPPYGTVPPSGTTVPPAEAIVPPAASAPAGWDDPTRRPGEGR